MNTPDVMWQDVIAGIANRAEYGVHNGAPTSNLSSAALIVPGLTSNPIRHFLNILCCDCNYLEVGSLIGATALAASLGNRGKYWAVDNFSVWPTVKDLISTGLPASGNYTAIRDMTMREAMHHTLEQFGHPYNFVEVDSRELDFSLLGGEKLDVFYYDGDHSKEATRDSIVQYSEVFADEVIVCFDDYGNQGVADGVQAGLTSIPWRMTWKYIMKWWNGFFVAGLERE